MPTKSKKEEKDLFEIVDDRPAPVDRRTYGKKIEDTMHALRPGQSFDIPQSGWYSLKNRLSKHPGSFSLKTNKDDKIITVWKR